MIHAAVQLLDFLTEGLSLRNLSIMESIKIVGLDGLYKAIKEATKSLQVTGWDIKDGRSFSTLEWGWGRQTSLLGWFADNLSSLKQGVENLRVVTAQLEGDSSYSVYGDYIQISSVRLAPDRIVVLLRTTRYEDNGWKDYSGRYEMWSHENETAFVIRTK